ncbi:hypothetical protein [Pedobacter sp. UC225_65]|uniref:hypothetical protein n=1 Tax=Pedobacter sp. UC225_65 TaxID=3350173 RepID=UPI0036715743
MIIVNELGQDEYINVSGDFKLSSVDLTASTTPLNQLVNGNTTSTVTEAEGIFTRPIKNIQLKIESATATLSNTLPTNIVIADCSKLIVIL